MKCEIRSVKDERKSKCGFSNFTLHPSNFLTAVKKKFEELGV
jgi:hypothetical protein